MLLDRSVRRFNITHPQLGCYKRNTKYSWIHGFQYHTPARGVTVTNEDIPGMFQYHTPAMGVGQGRRESHKLFAISISHTRNGVLLASLSD